MKNGSRTERQMPVARKEAIWPTGENAGQKPTEPQEKPPNVVSCALCSFIGGTLMWACAQAGQIASPRLSLFRNDLPIGHIKDGNETWDNSLSQSEKDGTAALDGLAGFGIDDRPNPIELAHGDKSRPVWVIYREHLASPLRHLTARLWLGEALTIVMTAIGIMHVIGIYSNPG
jgi:hypothetical protein